MVPPLSHIFRTPRRAGTGTWACLTAINAITFFQLAEANSAATCTLPISPVFAAHPECAQSCLGCDGSNESFAHACNIDNTCCQGSTASAYIPIVYACVKSTCGDGEAAESWAIFTENCARKGFPVDEIDTPAGYEYEKSEVPTRTATSGGSAPTGPGDTEDGAGTSQEEPTETQTSGSTATPTPGAQSDKGGLTKSETIAIAVGVPSALAAILGAIFKWRQWKLQKQQARAGAMSDTNLEKPSLAAPEKPTTKRGMRLFGPRS